MYLFFEPLAFVFACAFSDGPVKGGFLFCVVLLARDVALFYELPGAVRDPGLFGLSVFFWDGCLCTGEDGLFQCGPDVVRL